MSPFELYAELTRRGVILWADRERLRYRAAPGTMDESLRAQLVANKETIYRLLRNGVSGEASYPLSHGQRALWFLYKLDPQSAAYNTVLVARVHSAVEVAALGRAFAALAERHQVLRSTYAQGELGPMQHVHDGNGFSLAEIDGSRWSEKRLQQWLGDEARRPFNLEQGPVWRATLVRQSGEQGVLQLVVHHIAIDVMSYMVLIDELRELYPAARLGIVSRLAPPEAQYSDYMLWQAEFLSSAEGERLWNFWREQLAGKLPVIELPTDRPRPPLQTYRGASHPFVFDQKLIASLRTLADSERATLHMALLAAFAAVLHRYTGQEEMMIGSPTTGRTDAKFARVVGLFANLVALRLKVPGGADFRTLLKQVRQAVIEAQAHQGYPFSLLVERLQLQRDPSRTPLFQITFTLDRSNWFERTGSGGEVGGQGVDVGGLQLVPMAASEQEGQFDLALQIIERTDSFSAYLKYNTDLFDAVTIERMAGHYMQLLAGAVAEPGKAVWALPVLTEAEKTRLSVEWNRTETEALRSQLVHELLERQTERTPERTAVAFENQTLSYAELNRRANQLASHLRTLGVGPETLVGISVERSVEMLVAVLGVLKAGGAYVPLDPSHPPERLAMVLEDAKAKVLLTQEHLLARLPAHQAQVVCLDLQQETIAQAPAANLNLELKPENLAYVMYTSGSTGRPKGVQIPHAAVVNLLDSMSAEPGLNEDDVLLAVTNLSFDIAGLELFLPLSVGAKVVIANSETCVNGPRLMQLLAETKTTVMQATPVTWRLLLGSGWPGTPGLKILCGGEAFPRDLAEALLSKSAEVWNMYGPTETTIWSTVSQVSSGKGSVPIGRPIANTEVFILDPHQQLVPIGVWGELHIGGRGLARGYLNRPELTSERFIPNPFAPEARLYKTGDLARYLSDGTIEFQGRMDDQIKLRGFRIELGEIETALAAHPAVRHQAVAVRTDGGEGRLVAYVVLEGEESILTELPGFLRTKLPAYMVPTVFVPMKALPVTPNGKIDRRSLPAPAPTRPELAAAFAPPRNPLEQLLAQTYASVLGLDRVGIHDNFFELGGASLSSLEITAKLNEAGIPIPPESIFEYQTIAELAAVIESMSDGKEISQLLQEIGK
jgi:amino acid adenylation domain-containing protein